jgi:hypothetical protein
VVDDTGSRFQRGRGICRGKSVDGGVVLSCRRATCDGKKQQKLSVCTCTQYGIPVRTSISLPSVGLPPTQLRTDAKSLSPLEPLSSRFEFLEQYECGVLGDISPACSEDDPGFERFCPAVFMKKSVTRICKFTPLIQPNLGRCLGRKVNSSLGF